MLEGKDTTEISELGEFGLIKKLTEGLPSPLKSTIKGVGDDAAVIDHKNAKTLVTTDFLVEGVHFDLSFMPLRHLGYKSVMVNLSDIYAMNGTASQITVSLAISSKYSLEAIEEIYSGIRLAAEKYGVDIVGGDTTTSLKGLIISITAIGYVDEKKLVYRSGAKEKDLLCVTGDLGAAYIGLQLLEREKSVFLANPNMQPDIEGYDYILERQLKPEARKDMIELFEKMDLTPTSMIDISDGLSSEILHLCYSSNLGCQLHEEKIPIDPVTFNTAIEFKLDPTTCALNGGEDYELLFTIDQKDYDKIKGNPNISVIGFMDEKNSGARMVSKGGQVHPLIAQGWKSF